MCMPVYSMLLICEACASCTQCLSAVLASSSLLPFLEAYQHQSFSSTLSRQILACLYLLTLNVWHRPAAVEVTGTATAIPAHIDVVGDDHTRYLVSVRPALVPTNSSRLLGSSRGSRRTSLLLQSARQPFDDVKLGPLLGKGGFGRVYRAVWNGAAVACKVHTTSCPV